MTLANPGTNEPFSTAAVNANFEALDHDAGVKDASLTANASSITSVGNRVTTIEAGAGRGNLARETTTNPTTLSAIADALVGDMVRITTPGTGIDAFWAECWASPGSNAADWAPQDTIVAATKANLDTFIAAWIADTDLTFKIGQLAFVSGTNSVYRFTSTAGAYATVSGFPSVAASTANNTSGVVSSGTMVTIPTIPCSASVVLPVAQRAKVTIRFEFKATAVGSGIAIGAILTGATTFTPAVDTVFAPSVTSQNASADWAPYTVVIDYSLNAGTTAVTVGAQIIGPGSTRSIRHIQLFVEPLFV